METFAVEEVDFADLTKQVRCLVQEFPRPSGQRVILGITGSPGAGKSTLAQGLHHELEDVSAIVSMDGFHLSNDILAAAGSSSRKGAPDTFDVAGFVNLLARLNSQTDEIVYAPAFNRGIEESIGSSVPVHRNTPLVIVEGNYLLHDAGGWEHVREFLSETWFVSPPEEQRKRQLIARHAAFGRSPEEAMERALSTDQANADLIDHGRVHASRILHAPWIPGATPSA